MFHIVKKLKAGGLTDLMSLSFYSKDKMSLRCHVLAIVPSFTVMHTSRCGREPSAYNCRNNEFYEKPRKTISCKNGANTMSMLYQKKIRPLLAMTMLGFLTLIIAACGSVSATGTTPSPVNNSVSSTLNDIQSSTAGLHLNST